MYLHIYRLLHVKYYLLYMQDVDMKEDTNDGVWAGVQYYQCKQNRGIFVCWSAALKPGR